MLPRHSDCACLEDAVRKARSRANQPSTMRKAENLTERGQDAILGANTPPRLIDAARSRSRCMPRDD